MSPTREVAVSLTVIFLTLVYAWGNLIGAAMAIGSVLGWWLMPWSLNPVMVLFLLLLLAALLANITSRYLR